MVKPLKGVFRVRKVLADGTVAVYWYDRGHGRLPGTYGSPEMVAAWQANRAGAYASAVKGTLRGLIRAYERSPEWAKLAPRTQLDYRKQIARIETKWGNRPFDIIDHPDMRPRFIRWRNELAQSSARQADYAMAVLGIVLQWGVDHGYNRRNHAMKPRRLYRADRALKVWSPEQIAAFLRVADPPMQLAMVLALYTGQRQGDLLKLTWGAVEGDAITVRQGKRGALVTVPVLPDLAVSLERARKALKAATILSTASGRSWTAVHFQHRWRKTTIAAGLGGADRTFHDLRGTFVTIADEADWEAREIARITGWKSAVVEEMLRVYSAAKRQVSPAAVVKLTAGFAATALAIANQTANCPVSDTRNKTKKPND
jgi:integrase